MSLQYVDAQGNHYVRGWGQPDFTDAEKQKLGIGPYYGGAKPWKPNSRQVGSPTQDGLGTESAIMQGPGPGRRHNPSEAHYSWPDFGNKGKKFLKEDYINRWGPTEQEKEESRLHSQVSGQSATVPPALAEETLLAQNPSFDIGAGHRGASRNAKIHNLTRNNPNSKEVDAARQILGGISLPTF